MRTCLQRYTCMYIVLKTAATNSFCFCAHTLPFQYRNALAPKFQALFAACSPCSKQFGHWHQRFAQATHVACTQASRTPATKSTLSPCSSIQQVCCVIIFTWCVMTRNEFLKAWCVPELFSTAAASSGETLVPIYPRKMEGSDAKEITGVAYGNMWEWCQRTYGSCSWEWKKPTCFFSLQELACLLIPGSLAS